MLKELKYLNLVETLVTNSEDKRLLVFGLLPNLESLDFRGRDGEEIEYSSGEEDEESDDETGSGDDEDQTPVEDDDEEEEEDYEDGEEEDGEDELDDVSLVF